MDRKPIALESQFQKTVLSALKTLNNCYYHKHQAGSIRGIPDIIGSVGGVFFALELKRHRKALVRPLQKYTLSKIEASGALAFVVYPEVWPYVYDALRALSKGKEDVQNILQRLARSELQICTVQTNNLH